MSSRQHIVATIYDRRGRVLAVGHNSYSKTHPLQALFAKLSGSPSKIFLHAEIDALIRCRGKPHSIYIERKGSDGTPRLAAPCPTCQLAIKRAGIKEVRYTVGS